MPNIRVKQALDKLDKELNRVGEHVAHYSGIDAKDAAHIERTLDDIVTTANQIKGFAMSAAGRQFPAEMHRKFAHSMRHPVRIPE
jgi:short-subunit dehydrogenase